MESEPQHRLAGFLALNRTVAVVLITVLCFGLGEELWKPFMPVFLDAQTKQFAREAEVGTSVPWSVLLTVGVYACLINFMEGFCYIGGGQLTARLGDRGSLIFFALLTLSGYVLFLLVSARWATILAALLILGWEPLSVPVTFTTVGATVDPKRQGMAFAIQSIQKRLPKIIGPVIAGFALAAAERHAVSAEEGRIAGMRLLVGMAFALGLASLAIQLRWMPKRKSVTTMAGTLEILRGFPPVLRRLLLAEVFTRWCDWLVREFVVLYLVLVRGVSLEMVGILIAIQNFTALMTYLPIGRMTQDVGLRPFIGLTFIFFALFPLVLALVPDGPWMVLAFVVYGLREVGEPARKALITSSMPEPVRARGVGLYWGLRCFVICWSSIVGAVVWHRLGPEMLFYLAFVLGCVGAGIFYLFCRTPAAAEAG